MEASAFSLTLRVDEEKKRLYLTARGPLNSALYVDEQIALLKTLEEPWLYDRVIDLRDCRGFADYADLQRLAAYWSSVIFNSKRLLRVAVLTHHPLTIARMPIIDLLYAKQCHQTFPDHDAAAAWIDTPVTPRDRSRPV